MGIGMTLPVECLQARVAAQPALLGTALRQPTCMTTTSLQPEWCSLREHGLPLVPPCGLPLAHCQLLSAPAMPCWRKR